MAKLSDFDDIRPYSSGELQPALRDLLKDRQFRVMLKGFAPWLPAFVIDNTITPMGGRMLRRWMVFPLKD